MYGAVSFPHSRFSGSGRLRRFRQIGALMLWLGMSTICNSANAETWGERLGFPSDHRVLILHVQDLGMCYESTSAGTALLDNGVVTSASVMVPCPWFPMAAQWSAEGGEKDVGLSLTLNSELPDYRWRPVGADHEVATLLDADRFLWRSPTQVMVNASAEDVERELMAQIAHARARGLRPTHFTTHLGALVTRPDLLEVYLRIARRQWIPAMIVEVTPEHLARFEQAGFPLPKHMVQLLVDYPLPKVDDLRFVPVADTYDAKKQAFLEMIDQLKPGLTQIALHPATESEALKQIVPSWQQRVWERSLLEDDEVQKALHGERVTLTTWREVMARFDGTPLRREASAAADHSEALSEVDR